MQSNPGPRATTPDPGSRLTEIHTRRHRGWSRMEPTDPTNQLILLLSQGWCDTLHKRLDRGNGLACWVGRWILKSLQLMFVEEDLLLGCLYTLV
jgi:hypothetical protein